MPQPSLLDPVVYFIFTEPSPPGPHRDSLKTASPGEHPVQIQEWVLRQMAFLLFPGATRSGRRWELRGLPASVKRITGHRLCLGTGREKEGSHNKGKFAGHLKAHLGTRLQGRGHSVTADGSLFPVAEDMSGAAVTVGASVTPALGGLGHVPISSVSSFSWGFHTCQLTAWLCRTGVACLYS